MKTFIQYLSEESSDRGKHIPGQPGFSAKAEKKIQSTTGLERGLRRFISGDFRKNKTFPGQTNQNSTVKKPVIQPQQKKIVTPVKKVVADKKPVTGNIPTPDVKKVPIPGAKPVTSTNTVDTNQTYINKPKPISGLDAAKENLRHKQDRVSNQVKTPEKRPSSGILNMVPKERQYKGTGIIDKLKGRNQPSAEDPKHSNAIANQKARQEPIDVNKYKSTPYAEKDREAAVRGGPTKPPESKSEIARKAASDRIKAAAAKNNAGAITQARQSAANAFKSYEGGNNTPSQRGEKITPLQKSQQRAAEIKANIKAKNKSIGRAWQTKDINPNFYKGTPQAERDRADSMRP